MFSLVNKCDALHSVSNGPLSVSSGYRIARVTMWFCCSVVDKSWLMKLLNMVLEFVQADVLTEILLDIVVMKG